MLSLGYHDKLPTMATVLSQYSTTGFYKAPISKVVMGGLFLTCTAINVPLLAHLRRQLDLRVPDTLSPPLVHRFFTARLAFTDTKDLVCSALLIYYFRIFERRYGSRKFASYLMITWTLSSLLEVAVAVGAQQLGWELHPGRLLPPGPYGLVFPLFVSYLLDVPRVTTAHVLGLPVSGKTLTYLLGLQICSTSAAAGVSAICGLLAGLVYRRCGALRRLRLPAGLCWLAEHSLGRLLSSSPPQQGLMGATLEAQRAQQIEMLEQQMLLDRYRETRQRLTAGRGPVPHQPREPRGYADRLMDQGDQQPTNGLYRPAPQPDHAGAAAPSPSSSPSSSLSPTPAPPPPPPPSAECVRHLLEMGFPRSRVEAALLTTNNDMQLATTLLLQQS